MKGTGFIEGETVAIEYRLAENQIERLSALAAELVRRQVAAIAGPITSALVAKAATIPIVFVAGEDPVTLGLMRYANAPEATRVAVLVNPANPATAETTARDVQAAACGIPSLVEVPDASTSREIDGAFATAFFSEPPNNSFVGGDPLFGRRQMI